MSVKRTNGGSKCPTSEGILEHGLAVCMSGGGGDELLSADSWHIRDIIGKPFAATSGVSAGAINAVFFVGSTIKIN